MKFHLQQRKIRSSTNKTKTKPHSPHSRVSHSLLVSLLLFLSISKFRNVPSVKAFAKSVYLDCDAYGVFVWTTKMFYEMYNGTPRHVKFNYTVQLKTVLVHILSESRNSMNSRIWKISGLKFMFSGAIAAAFCQCWLSVGQYAPIRKRLFLSI